LGEISDEHEAKLRKSLKGCKSHGGITSVRVFTSAYPEYTNESGERSKNETHFLANSIVCCFCPNYPNMQSLLLLEPALKGQQSNFDCVGQMYSRLNTL
jgi:hypothetical protein